MANMTKDDREMLIRIDVKTAEMHKVLFGNGKPGLCEDFKEVQNNQKHCLESQKKRRLDFKWAVIVVLALLEAYTVYKGL